MSGGEKLWRLYTGGGYIQSIGRVIYRSTEFINKTEKPNLRARPGLYRRLAESAELQTRVSGYMVVAQAEEAEAGRFLSLRPA